MSEKVIRWGIMGAGAIMERFIKGLKNAENTEIRAIASRTREAAQQKAEKYGIPEVCTYEELAARDDIDAVYVCTIHTMHCPHAIMAMKGGKAVLVEKPAAVNAAQFEEMAACAVKNNVLLMEGQWTDFFPVWDDVREIIASGEIGTVRMMDSAFCFGMPEAFEKPDARLFDPSKAGGGLLDVGCYNLMFSHLVTGKYPEKITGLAAMNTDANRFGVDEMAAFTLSYDTGELSVCKCGIRCSTPNTAFIYGTKGMIEIPGFCAPKRIRVTCGKETREIVHEVPRISSEYQDEGFGYEIRHMNECLRRGLKESPVSTHANSLEILRECDELRAQWGLKYPFE